MSDLLYALAGTVPLWRNSAVAVLVFVVIGALMFYASVLDE